MQHSIGSGTILKIWAMESTNMTIYFLIVLETFSQKIMLNRGNFYMFPEILRKTKKF